MKNILSFWKEVAKNEGAKETGKALLVWAGLLCVSVAVIAIFPATKTLQVCKKK